MQTHKRALEILEDVIRIRRHLHQHPELSMQEFKTTATIAAELDTLGISYRKLDPVGLIAEIHGGKPGKTVALRADIDALPLTEMTDVPFRSLNPNVMHACGHDTHAAMLLGAARLLQERRDELHGVVRFFFQPGEESMSGANLVIAQGGLDGVDAVFGVHLMPQIPVGTVCLSDGVLFPSFSQFTIKVLGRSSHGAMPERGVDAIVAASAIVLNLQSIISRELSPVDPVVLTVGTLHAGTRFNILAGEAELTGAVRIFSPETRERMPEILSRVVRDTASAYRCSVEIDYQDLGSCLLAEKNVTAIARASAKQIVGAEHLQEMPKTMASEDFSEYTARCAGAYALLGGGGVYPPHSDKYDIDETAMAVGVALHAQFALDYLQQEAAS